VRKLAIIGAGLLASVGMALGTASSASAGQASNATPAHFCSSPDGGPCWHKVGRIDLTRYCRHLGFEEAVLLNDNVYGWRCFSSETGFSNISMNAACRLEYPFWAKRVHAKFRHFDNPYSWGCYIWLRPV